MKKHLVKVLSIVMALTMVLGVFGPYAVFAQNTDADHDHEDVEHVCVWGDVVVEDITCDVDGNVVDGKIYRECTDADCDEIYDLLEDYDGSLLAAIEAVLGVGCREHAAYTYALTKAPTCTEDGAITFTCSVCTKGYGKAPEVIPVKKLGHDYKVEHTKLEDCYNDGLDTYTCSRCGNSYTKVVNNFNGHNFVAIDVTKLNQGNCTGECVLGIPQNESVYEASTCCTNGYQYMHCSRCDKLSEKQTLKLADHKWTTETFTENSDSKYVIEGTAYTLDEVKANYTVTATTTTGTKTVTIIKEFIDGTVDCDDSQFRYKKCSVCGWAEQITKSCDLAHGHKWEAKKWNGTGTESAMCKTAGWVETKPNCITGQPGYWTRECTVCGATSQVNYTAWQHTMNRYSCTDGCAAGECDDCTHKGRTVECSVCYATNDTKTPVATCENHAWVKGTLVTAATCKHSAVYNWTCGNIACEQTKQDTFGDPNPKNHGDLRDATIIEATCGKPGSIEGYCNECQTYVNDTVPQVTGKHTGKVTDVAAKTPDCMNPGNTEGWHCEDCGASEESKPLPVDSNKHAQGCTKTLVLSVEGTCTADAVKVYYYSLCGKKEFTSTPNTKNPGNHYKNFVEWTTSSGSLPTATNTPTATEKVVVDVEAATCTEDGYHGYTYCKECGVITEVNTTSCAAAGCKLNAAKHAELLEKVFGTTETKKYTNGALVENEVTAAVAALLKIEKLGHDFSKTTKPAKAETCNAPGNVAEIYCQRECCQDEKVYQVVGGVLQNGATIAPHGYDHIFYENTQRVEPTCTEPGKAAGKFCSKCATACTYCQGNNPVIPALGHNIVKVLTVVNGDVSYDVYKCNNKDCFDTVKGDAKVTGTAYGNYIWYAQNYVVAEAPATTNDCEHPEASIVTTTDVEADCVHAGLAIKTCTACNEVVGEEVIPALGHKNADGNVIYLDCQNYETYKGQKCAKCGNEAGVALQHKLVFVETDPTCELAEDAHNGDIYYQCEDCELIVDMVMYEAFYKTMYGEFFVPATYKTPETLVSKPTTEALYVETVKFVPATSTEAGYWTWLCVCGDEHTTVLEYTHNVEFDLTVNPYTYNTDAEQELAFVNGGLIEVLVSVTAEDLAIKALNYTLEYSTSVLEFIGAELVYDTDAETEGVQNDFGTPICNDNNGTIKFLAMTQVGADSIALDGEAAPMIKFIFRIGEGVKVIKIDDVLSTAVEFNEEVVAGVEFNNLEENIDVTLIGDFNEDGKYTVDDVLALQEIINNPELPYTNVGDFNNDGRISIADFAAFAKFITSKMTIADYYTLLNGADAADIFEAVAGVINLGANWESLLGLGTVDGVLDFVIFV